ncbi:MAG: SH3 domain-containing protein [Clostridia bacterium]|nr:SH3 domain-containing protein [Clostridia bacterium]MBQ6326722.1 SH3 domain-containing protein [Clostridia bacterium]
MKNRIIKVLAMAVALMLILGLALAEVRTTGDVWLRTGPGLDYDAVSILSSGKSFEYLGESSVDERGVAWYRIIAGEKEGWVSSRYTELIGESAKAVDEAEVAEAVEPAPTDAPASQNALFAGLLFSSDASKEETDEKAEVEGTDEPVTDAPAEEPAEEAAETPAPVSANAPARTVELSTYYLRNLVEAANEIGLISYRQVESEVPYQYYDKALILAGNQQVESIVVYGPGYEIYGVSVGMDINAARACLNAAGLDYVESVNGVTYEHKATGASLFTDPSGHDSCINVWVNDGGTVTEIDWSTYTG